MSDQRRIRAELKQGLLQFLMTTYNSYRQSLGHEEAVQQIGICIKEQYEFFTKETMVEESAHDFSTILKSLEERAKKERDAVKQHEYYEDLEILSSAQEILSKYSTTGVSK